MIAFAAASGTIVAAAPELCRLSATDLAALLRARKVSAREVASAFLDHIDAVNPRFNAIVSLRPRDLILADADGADRALARGEVAGPLHGLPQAFKDLALTKGLRTTFGSPLFADFLPDVDAIAVERVRKAGAVVIGKTNTSEFGLGSQTYNNVFGITRNAYDPARTAGGSSGGAAAALALRLLPVADGSDMAGSLRNPAAYNNIFGLRPSFGRVPMAPAIDLFYQHLGCEGAMARSVRDLALLLSVQAGYDRRAPLSLEAPSRPFEVCLDADLSGKRIAWLADLGGHLPFEPGILELCDLALLLFGEIGCKVEPVVPRFDFERLWRSFVTLRQFTVGGGLKSIFVDERRRPLLKPEVQWEVEASLRLSAQDIHAAAETRTAWYEAILALFRAYDFLLLPTAQVFPFAADLHWPGEIDGRPMDSYHRWMEVVVAATMAGCPAISVPVGFDRERGPMGLQIIGPPRADLAVLQIAHAYEQVCPWIGIAP